MVGITGFGVGFFNITVGIAAVLYAVAVIVAGIPRILGAGGAFVGVGVTKGTGAGTMCILGTLHSPPDIHNTDKTTV